MATPLRMAISERVATLRDFGGESGPALGSRPRDHRSKAAVGVSVLLETIRTVGRTFDPGALPFSSDTPC